MRQVLGVGKCPYASSAAFQLHVPGSFLTVHEFEGKTVTYEDYQVVYAIPMGGEERECVYVHDWWYFQDADSKVKLIQIHNLDGDWIHGIASDVDACIVGAQLCCKCPTLKLAHYDPVTDRYTRCSSPWLQKGSIPNYIPLTSARIEDILLLRGLVYNTVVKYEIKQHAYVHEKGQPCAVITKSSRTGRRGKRKSVVEAKASTLKTLFLKS